MLIVRKFVKLINLFNCEMGFLYRVVWPIVKFPLNGFINKRKTNKQTVELSFQLNCMFTFDSNCLTRWFVAELSVYYFIVDIWCTIYSGVSICGALTIHWAHSERVDQYHVQSKCMVKWEKKPTQFGTQTQTNKSTER